MVRFLNNGIWCIIFLYQVQGAVKNFRDCCAWMERCTAICMQQVQAITFVSEYSKLHRLVSTWVNHIFVITGTCSFVILPWTWNLGPETKLQFGELKKVAGSQIRWKEGGEQWLFCCRQEICPFPMCYEWIGNIEHHSGTQR